MLRGRPQSLSMACSRRGKPRRFALRFPTRLTHRVRRREVINHMSTMLRDYWYIACAASRLGAAPLAIKVLDQELVVFKDASGGAHALLDRCCHRGARLSLGTVTDGALACGYHG